MNSSKYFMEFHSAEVQVYKDLIVEFPDNNGITVDINNINYFGILNFISKKVDVEKKPIVIFFTLDSSGSMSQGKSRTKRKIDYLKHTMRNILIKLSTITEARIQICIMTFNDAIDTIVDITHITELNVQEIIDKILSIEPESSTNLENVLKVVNCKINSYREQHSDTKIVHINMTDGEITEGEEDPNKLKQLIMIDIDNIFIGFGEEHDTFMLKTLSSCRNAEYHFVDNFENTGLVYGEIIHNIIYTSFENMYISVENGEIYNWETNNWSHYLYIGKIYSENERYFHIRSVNPENICAKIFYNDEHNNLIYDICEQTPLLIDDDGKYIMTDLTHFMFRQKTLELLYEVGEFNKSIYEANKNCNKFNALLNIIDYNRHLAHRNILERTQRKTLKTKIAKLIKMIMESIDTSIQDEKNKKMLKLLCDDLYVCYKTIDTPFSQMFSSARQSSQGRQTTYSVSIPVNIDDIINDEEDTQLYDNNPTLRRHRRNRSTTPRRNTVWRDVGGTIEDEETNDDSATTIVDTNFAGYQMSQTLDSPFCNQQTLDFMEEMND